MTVTTKSLGSYPRYKEVERLQVIFGPPSTMSVSRTRSPTGTVSDTPFITKTSVKTPGYRALIRAKAKLPENPFSYDMASTSVRVGHTVYQSNTSLSATYFHNTYGSTWGLAPYTFNLKGTYSLNSRLISKMKGSQWNVPVFVAEARKTSAMVVQRATHLATLVNDLRKGNIIKFVQNLHNSVVAPSKARVNRFRKEFGTDAKTAAASMWLETRYGWMPFMKDVHDAMETLFDTATQPSRQEGRVKAAVMQSGAFKELGVTLVNLDEGTIVCDRLTTWSESQRAVWRFTPNAADLPARFGLVNPLEVAWELVPLSFVVDWFVPIGDYLSALDVPLRVSHSSLTSGSRRGSYREYSNPRASNPNISIFNWEGNATWFNVDRKLGSQPALKLTDIPFSANLGTNQIWSSLALLWQQTDRLRKGKGLPYPYSSRRR